MTPAPVAAAVADLAARLRRRIEAEGPLPFAAWMAACLYDPTDGYYMGPGRKTGAGPDADFATNPTLHPFMAQAIAAEIGTAWTRLGRPPGFEVIECGGGEGDLARDALAWLEEHVPGLARIVTWTHIETSPGHRAAQADDAPRIRHAETLPAIAAGVVVAHEFLDALPFHWLEWDGDTWRSLHVTLDGDRFALAPGPADPDALAAAPAVEPEPGQRIVAMPAARDWIHRVGQRLEAGLLLVVDYGDEPRWLWTPDRPDGTVRGFRDHQIVDVLGAPGRTDITASIDLDLLRTWGEGGGLVPLETEDQTVFLARHGALDALAQMPRDTLDDASAYLRLRQMVLPGGMGQVFKVQRFWKEATSSPTSSPSTHLPGPVPEDEA